MISVNEVWKTGPDPDFPYLDPTMHFQFPDPSTWGDSVISIGGNLSPGILLSAYEQGIFPWYGKDDPIIWQSPDPRCVIFPDTFHVSRSSYKIMKQQKFKITYDMNFEGVIRGCAGAQRPNQKGTWITDDIIEAYMELHNLGWAHSAEAWLGDELVGGCYGVLLGKVFCGESMFYKVPNASKIAFISFTVLLFEHGAVFIDCQVPTSHFKKFGAVEIPRIKFLELLKKHKVFRF